MNTRVEYEQNINSDTCFLAHSIYYKREFVEFEKDAVLITQRIDSLYMINFCVSTKESFIKNRKSRDIHDVGLWKKKLN